ncbi:WD-repeat protein [Geitlerinema sp. FC II]|nr:WD-repeat protein [Geitlerinema sp. FC II]
MDVETALRFVEDLLVLRFGEHLTEYERTIFRGAWEGLRYDEIAGRDDRMSSIHETELRRIGGQLWRKLERLFEIPQREISIYRLRGKVEQQWRLREREAYRSSPTISESQPERVVTQPNLEFEPDRSVSQINSDFVGREQAFLDSNKLVRRGAKCILIQAPGGIGKTVLAEQYLTQRFNRPPLRFDIAKDEKNITSAEALVEQKLRELGEEPGREFGVSCDRLRHKLQSEPIGVLVDNLEPALDNQGKFIAEHRSYVELMRVLCDPSVQSVTLITSRERLNENLNIEIYLLKPLTFEAWKDYFQRKSLNVDSPVFLDIYHVYKGNALAMKILCQRISIDCNKDIEEYWERRNTEEGILVETAIENLIFEQFDRLENVDPTAYQLLCRMGCFRYQDVPTVPREGLLCLLENVPRKEGLVAIEALCDRSLVERVKREYKLHPLIQEKAIERLKENGEWENVNRIAARFWTLLIREVSTIEDAIKAFEAYHHYLSILDYSSAGEVILHIREPIQEKEWTGFRGESLGTKLYILGLIDKLCSAIYQIKNSIKDRLCLAQLYVLLGYAYNLSGKVHQGIDYHNACKEIALKALDDISQTQSNLDLCMKLKRAQVVSYFNLALCKLDLWEIAEAKKLLKMSLYLSKKSPKGFDDIINTTYACLAFAYSCDRSNKLTVHVAQAYKRHIVSTKTLDSWTKVYNLLFIGFAYTSLSDFQEARQQFGTVISKANSLNYTQAKAKAYSGIAEVDRKEIKFSEAIKNHSISTKLLEKIGAKCDLAEAYYQYGLTHQAMGNSENSQKYFQKALQIWEEIDAPKQIDRVRRSMENT